MRGVPVKCAYHPDVETNVSCANCGKPICPKDMVYTPVGIKCKECARPVGRMTAHGKPRDYAMAGAVGVAAAIGGGIALGELLRFVGIGTFILTLAYGYGVGEASSWAARRNGGLAYQLIAGTATLTGVAVAGLLSGVLFSPFFIAAGVFAVAIAAARMRE